MSTVQTLKLSGKPYVLLPKKEFRLMVRRLKDYAAEEKSDASIVRKRLARKQPLIPLAQVKHELGL